MSSVLHSSVVLLASARAMLTQAPPRIRCSAAPDAADAVTAAAIVLRGKLQDDGLARIDAWRPPTGMGFAATMQRPTWMDEDVETSR